ncbi:MAG: hypothetical protein K6G25_08995 [Bacteroidales bacterium]|nr:hypothetical protein [Bacteroidales bacterium]
MKKLAISLMCLVGVVLLFPSCSTSKFFSQKAADIHPIALIESYSYITDAVVDFSTDYLPDASRFNQLLVTNIVNSIGLPIEKTISVDFDSANPKSKLGSWMYNLVDLSSNSAKNLVVPAELRDAVSQSGCRYGLLITDVGYSKDAKQLALEEGVEIGMKIADFVLNNSIDFSKETEAYVNGVFALIFDNKTGQVVWYGSRPRRYEYNPLDRQSLTEQLTKLFKDFR